METKEVMEHPSYPGFYRIRNNDMSFNEYGVINRDGKVLSTIDGSELVAMLDRKGYLRVNFRVNGKRTQRPIHRLLGLTFIEKPERHLNKKYSVLEVNHIDTIKINNSLTNLEWVTSQENTEHAKAHGLIMGMGKSILARDVRTGALQRFYSTQACAHAFDTERKKLAEHLKSSRAGKVTLGWNVFKYDDGTAWPILPGVDVVENKWDYIGVIVGFHKESDRKVLFNNYNEIADWLSVPYHQIKKHIVRYGSGKLFKGWTFQYHKSVMGVDISQLKPYSVRTGGPSKAVKITNQLTGEVTVYQDSREASKKINLSVGVISELINHKGGLRENMKYEWI